MQSQQLIIYFLYSPDVANDDPFVGLLHNLPHH